MLTVKTESNFKKDEVLSGKTRWSVIRVSRIQTEGVPSLAARQFPNFLASRLYETVGHFNCTVPSLNLSEAKRRRAKRNSRRDPCVDRWLRFPVLGILPSDSIQFLLEIVLTPVASPVDSILHLTSCCQRRIASTMSGIVPSQTRNSVAD